MTQKPITIPWKHDFAVCDGCGYPSPADFVDISELVPQMRDLEAQNAKLVEALEEIRTRGYPCEGVAYYLAELADEALQQLKENDNAE